MKKFASLFLVCAFALSQVAFVGCEGAAEDVKKKAEEVKKEVKEGGSEAIDKAKKGDLEGAKKEVGSTAKDVKDVVTGDKKE